MIAVTGQMRSSRQKMNHENHEAPRFGLRGLRGFRAFRGYNLFPAQFTPNPSFAKPGEAEKCQPVALLHCANSP